MNPAPANQPFLVDADIPQGVLGWQLRRLIISDACISYARPDEPHPERWALADVAAIRFSYQVLMVYRFRFGTAYEIALQHRSGEEMLIKFLSWSAEEEGDDWQLYSDILDALETPVVQRLAAGLRTEVAAGRSVAVGRVEAAPEGVRWDDKPLITWDDCYVQESYHSFSINSRANPRLYAQVDFGQVWNAAPLLVLLEEKTGLNEN